jgi:acetyl-CoA acyltransferase
LVDKWQLTREELDAFAVESHRRAAAAAEAGWFEREIVPLPVPVPVMTLREQAIECAAPPLSADETIRPGTQFEKLATLKTSFRPEGGRITAGNSSQISDGAVVLLLLSAAAVKRYGVTPRARVVAITSVGSDPKLMLTGSIAATRKVLAQAGLKLDDIDLFEVNEAFPPVPLVWMKELGVSHERLNVNGGAIALGHPLGASGARIMTTLLHELERRGARYGLQTICCAGGMATATVIERLG